uniref:hypothetical protein n=1 Tax=Actinacidiphila soli TaxID=2487275 RepID=UPI0019D19B7A
SAAGTPHSTIVGKVPPRTVSCSFTEIVSLRKLQWKSSHTHRAASNLHHANRWIYERLTGSPVRMMSRSTASTSDDKPKKYPLFKFDIHPVEVDELTRHCRRLLLAEGIEEPLSWEPEIPETLDHMKFPGIPLDMIPPSAVHEILIGGTLSASAVAKSLDTSAAHIRCIMDRNPLSRREVVATRNETWRELYLSGQSITAIGRTVGGGHPVILKELRRMGVEIRPRAPKRLYAHLTQEVIHRYIQLEESLQEIADATGMCRATVRNMLKREGVSRRRCGRRPVQQ